MPIVADHMSVATIAREGTKPNRLSVNPVLAWMFVDGLLVHKQAWIRTTEAVSAEQFYIRTQMMAAEPAAKQL